MGEVTLVTPESGVFAVTLSECHAMVTRVCNKIVRSERKAVVYSHRIPILPHKLLRNTRNSICLVFIFAGYSKAWTQNLFGEHYKYKFAGLDLAPTSATAPFFRRFPFKWFKMSLGLFVFQHY